MIFKRKLYQKMLNWKISFNGDTALLIKGARRVGKSTLVEEFAKQEYESYILIDFSIASDETQSLFKDLSDLNYLFLRLQEIYNVELIERKSVIIFDEVQMQPLARQAIKHLVKDHRFDYIETGSLISIKKNIEHIVIPSEETRLVLYPMDFDEFCWALSDDETIEVIANAFTNMHPLGDELNRYILKKFRRYMFIGGMPQAVETYLNSHDMAKVDQVKRNIIELYEEDLRKIDPSGRAEMLFDSIPVNLNKNISRYESSNGISGDCDCQTGEIIADMQDSMTVYIAYHADDPSVGMALNKDPYRYKMFLCDTGLFVTLAFKDKDYTENEIYRKLLNGKMMVNLGYVFENVVAQMLKASGNELFYYTFSKDFTEHKYEIDFLLSRNGKICPLEVKSSDYNSHSSIDAFHKKFSKRIFKRYLIYTKDIKKERDMIYLPVYMTSFL